MNQVNSKEEVLLAAAINILSADTIPVANSVREISFYCNDRIYRTDAQITQILPSLTLNTEELASNFTLPTSEYILEVTAWVNFSHSFPLTTINNFSARVIYLLDKQMDSLNDAVPGKNLRCRLISKLSSIKTSDAVLKVYQKTMRFRVVLDDETLE